MNKPISQFYESGLRSAARYISGNTIYEECLQNGRFIGLYWASDGQVQRENTVENFLPRSPVDPIWRRMNSFNLDVDGQALDSRWAYTGGSTRQDKSGFTEAVVGLRSELRPIFVKVVTRLDGTSVLARYLEITNTGDKPAALGSVQPLSGMLWDNLWMHAWDSVKIRTPFDINGKSFYSVGYLQSAMHDTALFGHEGNFVWQDIVEEYSTISRLERKSHGGPFFVAKNNLTGECFFISLAWSAGFEMKLWYDRPNCSLNFGVGPSGPAPLRVIVPGETVVTPAVHIAPMHCDFDGMVANWYAHLRTSVLAKRPDGKEMYTIAARVVEQPGNWILREIDIAAEMGAEAYMVDAGWYGDSFETWTENRGDWFEGDFLPEGGLSAIRDYTHNKGMLFGLWMEPEALGLNSRPYKEHPEWRVTYDGTCDKSAGVDSVLNMAIPEAAEFIRNAILKTIGDKKLDF